MRAKGEGTISYEKATKTFLVKVPIGRYPSGKTRYKTQRTKTKSEATRLRLDLLSERREGRLVAGPKESLRTYGNWYLANEAGKTMRPTTIYNVAKNLENYVYPYLGNRPLIEIEAREITEAFNHLRTKYSASTVNNARSALSSVFSSAVRNGKVNLNPVSRTQKFKRGEFDETQVQPPYSREEVLQLLNAAKGTVLDLFIHLAAFTGMRRGEILGLRWSDINYDEGYVFVSRTLKEGSRFVPGGGGLTKPVFNEPKTASSKRVVHVPVAVVNALRRHELFQGLQKDSLEGDWFENDLIFTNPVGGAVYPSNYSYKFRTFLKKQGLRHIRIHDLRHTFATLALENGVQLAAITQTLGHSGIEITKNIYARCVPALEIEATTAIAHLLDPLSVEPVRDRSSLNGLVRTTNRPGWSQ